MLVNFLGDSITFGVGAESPRDMYVEVAAREAGITVNNYGISGTRIARQKAFSKENAHDFDFLMRAPDMDKNADFVFVFGGTNDYGHGDAVLGEIEDKTPYSFYGAMNLLTEMLIKDYGREKLCFILPLHRENEDDPRGSHGMKEVPSAPLSKYVKAIAEVTSREGIDYLDLGDDITPERVSELTTDGLHPNNKGHEILGKRVAEYLKNKFLK